MSNRPPDRRRAPSTSLSHSPHSDLSRSMSSLSLHAPSSTSSRRAPLSPLSRRQSVDLRSMPASPSTLESPRRLARSPSTPNIRKRASMNNLNSSASNSSNTTPLRRKSSLLSLHSSPVGHQQEPPPSPPKPLSPPPQDLYAETTVVLQDTSYGHKYSRPRTSAAELANIVERPERIAAAVLGVAAAQVCAGKDRLSIRKTTRQGKLSDPEVMMVHAHTPVERGKVSWPEELQTLCRAALEKLKRGEVEVPKPYHAGDLYLSGKSFEAVQGCVGALYEGVDLVFGEQSPVKRGFVCIRPPGHHCAEASPSGFCFLNNIHIAIARAAKDYGLTHAVILDFDLHHGDGSQAIAWSINGIAAAKNPSKKKTAGIPPPTIGYFSMHDINSFPCESGVVEIIRNASVNLEAHNQFIQNVHMQRFSNIEEFWELYTSRYHTLIAKARQFLSAAAATSGARKGREFKAGVFLSAGFDASEHEGAGMQRHAVCVPTDFFAKFTADAVELADELCGGRVLSVLEGGYSDRAITSGVFAHISGLACPPPDRAEYVPPSITGFAAYTNGDRPRSWDSDWWSIRHLEELERLTEPIIAKKEARRTTSFMTPTAASVAKANDSPRRMVSSSSLGSLPPPPPTPWEVQAYELSRRFIPEYEESKPIPALEKPAASAAASTALKRHSIATPTERMTLRERKPKAAPAPPVATVDKSRRRTTAGPHLDPAVSVSRAPSRTTSRATTPALSRGPSPPTRTSSTTGGSKTIAPPRKKPAALQKTNGIEELTGKLSKIKLTYKNEAADRERAEQERRIREEEETRVRQLEMEKAELERQVAKAKEREEKRRIEDERRRAEEEQMRQMQLQQALQYQPQEQTQLLQQALNFDPTQQQQIPQQQQQEKPPEVKKLQRRSGLPVGVKNLAARFQADGEATPQVQRPQSQPLENLAPNDHRFQGGDIRFGNPFPNGHGMNGVNGVNRDGVNGHGAQPTGE